MNPEIIGMAAAVLTTAAYIPQTLKIIREKHTKSISLGMYSMLTLGIFLWMVYGMMLGSPSLILANGISCAMACFILVMKMKHG